MFKKKIQHTKFIFTQDDPLTLHSDLLVNWTVTSLLEGDELFVRLHKEGGSLIAKDLLKYKAQTPDIPLTTVLLTNSGILAARKILHCVLPNFRIKEEKEAKESYLSAAIENVFYFIKNHKQDFSSMRTIIFTPVPQKVYGRYTPTTIPLFIKLIRERAVEGNLREVQICCTTPEDYKAYSAEFQKQTFTKFEKFLRFFRLK